MLTTHRSGSRFLSVATQGVDLMAELLGTLEITAGEGNGQGELKFLKLVFTLQDGLAGTPGGDGHGRDRMAGLDVGRQNRRGGGHAAGGRGESHG
jgi:hypothetical protein